MLEATNAEAFLVASLATQLLHFSFLASWASLDNFLPQCYHLEDSSYLVLAVLGLFECEGSTHGPGSRKRSHDLSIHPQIGSCIL